MTVRRRLWVRLIHCMVNSYRGMYLPPAVKVQILVQYVVK